jgi:hypothetical protein
MHGDLLSSFAQGKVVGPELLFTEGMEFNIPFDGTNVFYDLAICNSFLWQICFHS